jgi:hypothetical protein
MRSVKSFYSRTASKNIKVISFTSQDKYIEFIKSDKYHMIHGVEGEDGIIIVKYTE